jgi:hypothetical protein
LKQNHKSGCDSDWEDGLKNVKTAADIRSLKNVQNAADSAEALSRHHIPEKTNTENIDGWLYIIKHGAAKKLIKR